MSVLLISKNKNRKRFKELKLSKKCRVDCCVLSAAIQLQNDLTGVKLQAIQLIE